jgi:hypothetical protein
MGALYGPQIDAFGFFRSARRKGVLCSTLSLPMARDGQQPDRACGPSAVDARGRQSQGVCVQNGLDLSGSAGDRRGSPGRSERRFVYRLVLRSVTAVLSLLARRRGSICLALGRSCQAAVAAGPRQAGSGYLELEI